MKAFEKASGLVKNILLSMTNIKHCIALAGYVPSVPVCDATKVK